MVNCLNSLTHAHNTHNTHTHTHTGTHTVFGGDAADTEAGSERWG